ncbi:MAG: EAL domain-containing protein [Pseudomonadota bacterium]
MSDKSGQQANGQPNLREGLLQELQAVSAELVALFDTIPGQLGILRRQLAKPPAIAWDAAVQDYSDWLDSLRPTPWRDDARAALTALAAPEPTPDKTPAVDEAQEIAGRLKAARRRLQGPVQFGDAASQRIDHALSAITRAGNETGIAHAATDTVAARLVAGLASDLSEAVSEIDFALADLKEDLDKVQAMAAAGDAPAAALGLDALDPGSADGLSDADREQGSSVYSAVRLHCIVASVPILGEVDPVGCVKAQEKVESIGEVTCDAIRRLAGSLQTISTSLRSLIDPAISKVELAAVDLTWLEKLYTMEDERRLHASAFQPVPGEVDAMAEDRSVEPEEVDPRLQAPMPEERPQSYLDRVSAVRDRVRAQLVDPNADLVLRVCSGIIIVSALGVFGTTLMIADGHADGSPQSGDGLWLLLALLAELCLMVLVVRAIAKPTLQRLRDARDEMERMALCDALTELYNRRGLQHYLTEALAPTASGYPGEVAVMHIDLDHFKSVNDTLGHDAGDHVLKITAERMTKVIRDRGRVCRVGGDEFCVAMPGLTDIALTAEIAGEIVQDCRQTIEFEGKPCQIGTSIGIAYGGGPANTSEPNQLLTNADLAVFVSKAGGRGRFTFFDGGLRTEMEAEIRVLDRLRAALDAEQMQPWFQPVMDTDGSRILSAEALLRCPEVDGSYVDPENLIVVAEKNNLLDRVNEVMIATTLKTMAEWRKKGVPVPRITLNLTGPEVKAHGFVDRLKLHLDALDLHPNMIGVEVAENVCNERGAELAIKSLHDLRALGVEVTVDDFGRDQASLSNLTQMKAAAVKIDQNIVSQLGQNAESAALLSGLVALARSMNLKVIAAGVEGREQLRALQAIDCDGLQGFAVARPMPSESFAEWLELNGGFEDDGQNTGRAAG